jgi:hypothetical protein
MKSIQVGIVAAIFVTFAVSARAADSLETALAKPILDPGTTLAEVQKFCESRVPAPPTVRTAKAWDGASTKIRADVLDKIVFRGEAAKWRTAETKVEWLDTIDGGPGYTIRKLRYEAIPGLWVPALLYQPDKLHGRVPVVINFNGHVGPIGKAVDYKQVICINQARRGMLALNVEWIGMGQLAGQPYNHNRLNQLDLCGTSGLAPFFLLMTRALDAVLALPNADSTRVAVTGLSGGGWQSIVEGSLDPRVSLCVPVAGYSSLKTRARNLSDLGDAEQTPSDLATVADYATLTAMLAPHPTLLIYNRKDDCCFASDHALKPLLDAAGPFFSLYGKRDALQSHVNEKPGTHNYEKDNREAFYRFVGDHFFPGDAKYQREELACSAELKTEKDLHVELPAGEQVTFNSLAKMLAKDLPKASAGTKESREKLNALVHFTQYAADAKRVDSDTAGEFSVTRWRLKLGSEWTVPAVEMTREKDSPKLTAIVINDAGRNASAKVVSELLSGGHRVIALDPFYYGESNLGDRAYLLALLVAAVGERPLGIEAGQVAAAARWARDTYKTPVTVVSIGPRSSVIALVAAALETDAVASLELRGPLSSLKELIEKDRSVDELPDLFCFGLLESLDVPQLKAFVAPRPIR